MNSLRRLANVRFASLPSRDLRRQDAAFASNFAPATRASVDGWTAVFDRESGLTYYWNTKTDETTALGAPHPAAGRGSALSSRTMELVQMGTIGFGFGLILSIVNKIL